MTLPVPSPEIELSAEVSCCTTGGSPKHVFTIRAGLVLNSENVRMVKPDYDTMVSSADDMKFDD